MENGGTPDHVLSAAAGRVSSLAPRRSSLAPRRRARLRVFSLVVALAAPAAAHSRQPHSPILLTATAVEAMDLGPGGCPSETLRVCSGHGKCDVGHCRCDRGFSGVACTVREYLLACPHNCSAPFRGQCIDRTCVCADGFSGDDCAKRTPVNCTLTCAAHGHGECVAGQCACRPGFYGPDCLQGCPGFDLYLGKACSGHGLCVPTGSPGHSLDRCKCFVGFDGPGCEDDLEGVTTCARNCSWPRGSCAHGRCTCAPSFAGHDCSIELRHGQLTHALDSGVAKLGAILGVLILSVASGLLLLRYINAGAEVAVATGLAGANFK